MPLSANQTDMITGSPVPACTNHKSSNNRILSIELSTSDLIRGLADRKLRSRRLSLTPLFFFPLSSRRESRARDATTIRCVRCCYVDRSEAQHVTKRVCCYDCCRVRGFSWNTINFLGKEKACCRFQAVVYRKGRSWQMYKQAWEQRRQGTKADKNVENKVLLIEYLQSPNFIPQSLYRLLG